MHHAIPDAKVVAGMVAAYALSPIDLIPDFIPELGYLDDLMIMPLGILLAVKLIPAPVLVELRERALIQGKPTSRAGLAAVIVTWLTSIALVAWLVWPRASGNL